MLLTLITDRVLEAGACFEKVLELLHSDVSTG